MEPHKVPKNNVTNSTVCFGFSSHNPGVSKEKGKVPE